MLPFPAVRPQADQQGALALKLVGKTQRSPFFLHAEVFVHPGIQDFCCRLVNWTEILLRRVRQLEKTQFLHPSTLMDVSDQLGRMELSAQEQSLQISMAELMDVLERTLNDA